MANKRMFSIEVIDTDKFLDMPVSTQCLYFHLGMRADDEGFVSSPKKIVKLLGCSNDDLKLLIAKGYIIPFEEGVVVIVDWNVNNYIRPDRIRKTQFKEERERIDLIDGRYSLSGKCLTVDGQEPGICPTQYSIDKISIDTLCPEPEKSAPDGSGILLPLNDKSFYDVPLEKIALWKDTYPALDVERELKKMTAWLDSNPTRKKTRRGIDRFINAWLSREQDRGGTRAGADQQRGTREGKGEYSQEYRELYSKYLGKNPAGPEDPFQ